MNDFMNILSSLLQVQDTWLFKSEKINTVIVVIMVIWLGIVVYLLWTGKKVAKLEKEMQEMKQDRGLDS